MLILLPFFPRRFLYLFLFLFLFPHTNPSFSLVLFTTFIFRLHFVLLFMIPPLYSYFIFYSETDLVLSVSPSVFYLEFLILLISEAVFILIVWLSFVITVLVPVRFLSFDINLSENFKLLPHTEEDHHYGRKLCLLSKF